MKDPSVVIVIGASQGIGRARAVRLAHDFSAVVLAARHEEELRETAAAVKSTGDEPLIFAVDLREPQSGEIIVKEISWCAPPDHPNLGRIEGLEWICRSDLRKRRSRSEAFAAVNAAIIAVAKAFAEQGIKDGVQVNSVVPGAVMTGRRESFFRSGRRHTTSRSMRQSRSFPRSWHRSFRQARSDC